MKKGRRNAIKSFLAAGTVLTAGWLALKNKFNPNPSGDTVKLLSQDGELVEVDREYLKVPTHAHAGLMQKSTTGREAIPGKKFVMVIDLARCRNALKCVTACQKMHFLPDDKEWVKIKLMKDTEKGAPYWFPKICFHCDNAPCVKVCPVAATYKREDGLVLIDNDRCIGCKFCMAACPYSTRVFNWEEPYQPEEVKSKGHDPEMSLPAIHGTVDKCDFCPDMVRQGKLPDCVTACPNGVFYFGDENEDAVTNGDETVKLSQLLKDKAGYRYMEELGTEPRVYYLPATDRMFPMERGLKGMSEEEKEKFKDILE